MSIDLKVIRKIEEELGEWDLPSLGLGIIKNGSIEYADGIGFANLEGSVKSNADTLYQIGSCSKAFTATACAVLVDQGKLEWDKPVLGYMPWLRFKDPFTTYNVTVRDLLCHRTGLPRHDAYWIDGPFTRRGMVENLRNMEPAWSFRSHWCYQNTCFVAAGMLVEEISGMSWENFVSEYILEPLGMTRTTFYVDQILADSNHATPYDRPVPTDLKGIREIPFLKVDCEDMAAGIGASFGPAGSIVSTVNDMCKWLQFNLNNGKVGDVQVVSEENMKQLHKPQMVLSEPLLPVPGDEMDFHSYGMGWFVETFRGHKMVEHGGNINGFSALVTLVPDLDLGVVCLANFNDAFNTYSSTYEIIDHYLGIEDGDWDNRLRDFVAVMFSSQVEGMKALRGEPVPDTIPSHPLSDYVGIYRNATYGDIVISLQDDVLHFLYNKKESPTPHFHYDTFLIDDRHALFDGMTYRFTTSTKGEIDGLLFGIALNPAVPDERFVKVTETAAEV